MADVDTADPTDPADDDHVTPPPGGGRSPALVLAISLAVIFGLAAAVLGLVAVREDKVESGSVTSLRKAAGEVGVALLTYDFHDPDDHKQRVLALATGSFRGEYESAFDQGLGDLITKVQATSEGFVKDVYVSQIDQERGEAIVRADVTRNGAGGERTLFDIYLLLTFVHVDDAWKVDQVTDLNFATEGDQGTSANGTTTPSTPVP
jgi:hypothetical protein